MLIHPTPADWTRRKGNLKGWTCETAVPAGFTSVSVLIESHNEAVLKTAKVMIDGTSSLFKILPGSAVAKIEVEPGDTLIVKAAEPAGILRLLFSNADSCLPVTASVLPKSLQAQFSSQQKKIRNPIAELAKRLSNNDLAGAIAMHCMARRSGASEEECVVSAQFIIQKMVEYPLLRDPALGAFIIAQTRSRP